MTRSQTHRRISRSRKNSVPLAKLRTAEAVKTVVDHPRRLRELAGLFEDKDILVRERAAAATARLAESHPGRLVRIIERLKAGLADDSAFVRWHLAYALGRLALNVPAKAPVCLPDLIARLADENRVVRSLAAKALRDLAARKPEMVVEAFSASKQAPPFALGRRPVLPGKQEGK